MATRDERIYKRLVTLFPEILNPRFTYQKYESEGYMSFSIEKLHKFSNERLGNGVVIAMAHRYEQNGDLMSDPDMEVLLDSENQRVKAMTYTNHSMGVDQRVYEFDGNGKLLGRRLRLERDLSTFLEDWTKNLKSQGYTAVKRDKVG